MNLFEVVQAMPETVRRKITDDVDAIFCDYFPLVLLIREVPVLPNLRKERPLRSKLTLIQLACETLDEQFEMGDGDAWWRNSSFDQLVENWDQLLYEIGWRAIYNGEVILPEVLAEYRDKGRLERLRTRALELLAQINEPEITAALREESGNGDRRMPSVFKEVRTLAMLTAKPGDVDLWSVLYAAEVLEENSFGRGKDFELPHSPISEKVKYFRRAYPEKLQRIGPKVDNTIARFNATVLPNMKAKYAAYKETRVAAE